MEHRERGTSAVEAATKQRLVKRITARKSPLYPIPIPEERINDSAKITCYYISKCSQNQIMNKVHVYSKVYTWQ
jgi:hypothetical protein